MEVVKDACGHVIGTYSWAAGFIALRPPAVRCLTEREALAEALRIERIVSTEAAFHFLEEWERSRVERYGRTRVRPLYSAREMVRGLTEKERLMASKNDTSCVVCKRPEARWVMRVDKDRHSVHRQCGVRIRQMAPEGQSVKLFPTEELKREMDAQAFWSEKLKQAGFKLPPGQPAKTG